MLLTLLYILRPFPFVFYLFLKVFDNKFQGINKSFYLSITTDNYLNKVHMGKMNFISFNRAFYISQNVTPHICT